MLRIQWLSAELLPNPVAPPFVRIIRFESRFPSQSVNVLIFGGSSSRQALFGGFVGKRSLVRHHGRNRNVGQEARNGKDEAQALLHSAGEQHGWRG